MDKLADGLTTGIYVAQRVGGIGADIVMCAPQIVTAPGSAIVCIAKPILGGVGEALWYGFGQVCENGVYYTANLVPWLIKEGISKTAEGTYSLGKEILTHTDTAVKAGASLVGFEGPEIKASVADIYKIAANALGGTLTTMESTTTQLAIGGALTEGSTFSIFHLAAPAVATYLLAKLAKNESKEAWQQLDLLVDMAKKGKAEIAVREINNQYVAGKNPLDDSELVVPVDYLNPNPMLKVGLSLGWHSFCSVFAGSMAAFSTRGLLNTLIAAGSTEQRAYIVVGAITTMLVATEYMMKNRQIVKKKSESEQTVNDKNLTYAPGSEPQYSLDKVMQRKLDQANKHKTKFTWVDGNLQHLPIAAPTA